MRRKWWRRWWDWRRWLCTSRVDLFGIGESLTEIEGCWWEWSGRWVQFSVIPCCDRRSWDECVVQHDFLLKLQGSIVMLTFMGSNLPSAWLWSIIRVNHPRGFGIAIVEPCDRRNSPFVGLIDQGHHWYCEFHQCPFVVIGFSRNVSSIY